MPCTVGVDVGTQGLKVLVYDSDARQVVGRGATAYGLLPTEAAGRAEQWPQLWLNALGEAARAALREAGDPHVAAVAVSGQQHGLCCVGAGGEVVRPAKLWCDVESAAEAAELSLKLGVEMPAGFTATKVLWLARHEPDNWAKTEHVLLPHDYVNYVLTGTLAMECGDASGIGVLDVAGRVFDQERCAAVDPALADRLPPLAPPDAPIGTVTEDAASRFGLAAGAKVAVGGGDNMMSALGSGAVRPGVLVLSLGTSATLFGYSDTPILDKTGTVAPFCDCTGAWLPLLCVQNCTGAPEEVAAAYGMSHADLTELASNEPAGCSGVTFLPYLTGERTPNWPHASGALLGLRPGALRPGVVYRAALEGATFTVLSGYRRMQQLGFEASELRVVGGGSKNPLWRQIIADAFQVPLRFPLEPESAALGAALQAAAVARGEPVAAYVAANEPPLADEVVTPNPTAAIAYAGAFAQYEKLGRTLFADAGHAL